MNSLRSPTGSAQAPSLARRLNRASGPPNYNPPTTIFRSFTSGLRAPASLHGRQAKRGFTLVELMVGMTLSLIVMSAVLSSYTFLGRNLTRLANQQSVETEARRVQAYFAQDARAATGVSSPTATSVTLTFPAASATNLAPSVTYTYYSSATTVDGLSVPAYSLVRAPSSGPTMIMVRDIVPLSFGFSYYDVSGAEYVDPTLAAYRLGLKQISFAYVARTGSGVNGTLTPNYTAESPRFALRNKGLTQ